MSSSRLRFFESSVGTKVLIGVTLLMALQTIRSVIWFTLVALMLTPAVLDGVLKPNARAMRFRVLNRALIAVSVAGVVLALAVVAAKPSSWFERNYPAGVLAAYDRAHAQDLEREVGEADRCDAGAGRVDDPVDREPLPNATVAQDVPPAQRLDH